MSGLNAPFGARCFVTNAGGRVSCGLGGGLNAPFGARCFVTVSRSTRHGF